MAGVRVARVTVPVGDVRRSVGLYGEALGLTVLYRDDDMAMLQFTDRLSDQSWGERQAVLADVDGHILCLVAPIAP